MKQFTPNEMSQQIGKMNVGIKDVKLDWKELGVQIFRKETGKQKLEDRMKELSTLVNDYGEYERLVQSEFF
jgi:hypothetical protein